MFFSYLVSTSAKLAAIIKAQKSKVVKNVCLIHCSSSPEQILTRILQVVMSLLVRVHSTEYRNKPAKSRPDKADYNKDKTYK